MGSMLSIPSYSGKTQKRAWVHFEVSPLEGGGVPSSGWSVEGLFPRVVQRKEVPGKRGIGSCWWWLSFWFPFAPPPPQKKEKKKGHTQMVLVNDWNQTETRASMFKLYHLNRRPRGIIMPGFSGGAGFRPSTVVPLTTVVISYLLYKRVEASWASWADLGGLRRVRYASICVHMSMEPK